MTLNGVMAVILHYFTEFDSLKVHKKWLGYIPVAESL